MSGGSFDYICYKEPEDLVIYGPETRRFQLIELMALELAEFNGADSPRADTLRIAQIIREVHTRIPSLTDEMDYGMSRERLKDWLIERRDEYNWTMPEDIDATVEFLHASIDEIRRLREKLEQVWHGVEWYSDNDFSRQQAQDEIDRYGG